MKEKIFNTFGTIVLVILGVLFPAVKMAYIAVMALSLMEAVAWLLVPSKAETAEKTVSEKEYTSVTA